MTDSKIVSLGGATLPEPGKVNPRIVEVLENELEKARAGRTAGIIIIGADHECSPWYRLTGQNLCVAAVVGAVHVVSHELTKDMILPED